MAQIFFYLVLLLLPCSGFSYENQFCKTTTGVDQINDYIHCAGSPKLTSCGVLAGIAAGREVAKQLRQREIEFIRTKIAENDFNFKKSHLPKIRSYAEYEKMLKAEMQRLDISGSVDSILKKIIPEVDPMNFKPRVPPQLSLFKDRIYDLYQMEFPQISKESNGYQLLLQQNQLKTELIIEQARLGKPLDDAFASQLSDTLKKRMAQGRAGSYSLPGKLPPHIDYPSVEVKNAIDTFNQELMKTKAWQIEAAKQASQLPKVRMAAKVSSTGVSSFARGMGTRMLGAALAVVTTEATACSSMDEKYINSDENCNPVYEVNQKVSGFLNLPPNEKLTLLKESPGLCRYYQTFYQKLFKDPKVTSLLCFDKSFEATVKNSEGTIVHYKGFRGVDDKYKSITSSGTSLFHGTFNLNEKEELVNFINGKHAIIPADDLARRAWESLEIFNGIKLYIPEIQDCCRNKSEHCPVEFGLKVDDKKDNAAVAEGGT